MSDINKIFKDAIDGYEAPFDASAWDKLSKQLNNPMEDAFRNSVEGHEAAYNPNAWSAIKGKIGSTPSLFQWIAGSTAAAILVTTAILIFPSNEEKSSTDTIITANDNIDPKNGSEKIHATIQNETNANELIAESSNETANDQIAGNDSDDNLITNDNRPSTLDNSIRHTSTAPGIDITPTVSDNTTITITSTPDPDLNISPSDRVPNEDQIVCTAEFSSSTLEICQGESVLFDSKMSKGDFEYEWNFGDGYKSASKNTSHEFNNAGIYNVNLTLRDKKSNEILASNSQTIIVNKTPEIKFELDQLNNYIPSYLFTNESELTNNLTWRIDNRLFADKNTFEYTFRDKGTYAVQLTGENEFGCSNSATKEIVIEKDFNLGAPTAFTPEGTTDYTFMPSALKIMNREFNMIVYSPAGTPIYQTNNANEPWTGIDVNTNAPAPSGTMYTWIVYLTNVNGTTDRYYGQVLKL